LLAARTQLAMAASPLYARLSVTPGTAALDAATAVVQRLVAGEAQWTVAPAAGVSPEAVWVRADLSTSARMSVLVAGRTAVLAGARPDLPETVKAVAGVTGLPALGKAVLFSEGFEAGDAGWTRVTDSGTVPWGRVVNPQEIRVQTPTISPELVLLPDAGYLPSAYAGQACYWFGSAEVSRGTFIGDYHPDLQSALGGGTSTDTQMATLTSPPIDLTGVTAAALRFWTWWETEGVDVAAAQYDQMVVGAVTPAMGFELIGTINPLNDVDGEAFRPYSSGGLGKPGAWLPVTFDLSHYAGQAIQIAFRFDTKDSLYNGFRGWLIDAVSVESGNLAGPVITEVVPAVGVPGDIVSVCGLDYVAGATLALDGAAVPTAVLSSDLAQFEVPDWLGEGRYDVTLTNPDGQSGTLQNGFSISAGQAPVVLSITPGSGPVYTGIPVAIGGAFFAPGAQVQIRGWAATGVTVVDPETITCTAPDCLAPGFHNVTVTNPDGLHDALFGAYEAAAVPDCDGYTPDFVRLLSAGFATADTYPEITVTVLVDTPAGQTCELGSESFAVTEDGLPQQVTTLTCSSAAGSVADIAVVFDDTAGMDTPIAALQGKASAFAQAIVDAGVDARFALVSFGDPAEIHVDLPLTADLASFQTAVRGLHAAGGGDLPDAALDAVWTACTALHWRPGAQRFIVLITDAPTHYAGDGSGLAERGMAETVALVEAMGGTVFAVGPALDKDEIPDTRGCPVPPKAYGDSRDVMTLATDTGGEWHDLATVDLGLWVDWIAQAVASVYTLTYTSTHPDHDGTWRNVTVTVNDPWGKALGATKAGITDCDDGLYQAPYGGFDCDQAGRDVVHVMAVGQRTPSSFPEITATVSVDSEAGYTCALGRADFVLWEDHVRQVLTSATCVGTVRSAADVHGAVQGVTALYTLTYTASNGLPDGTWRDVVVQVQDPVEAVDCDAGTYQAPQAAIDCENGDGSDFAWVMGVAYAADEIFPQVAATVRVDTAAGRQCGLTAADVALSEDGVVQRVTSVTCSGSAGSVADIVVCFDDTASMGEQIEAMKAKANAFSDALAAVVDARFALVTFKDDETLRLGFTADRAAFRNAVNALVPEGGGDLPETSLDAVMLALSPAMGWRAGAQKIIIVVTDAPSHYDNDGTAITTSCSMDSVIAALSAAGAAVFAVAPTAARSAGEHRAVDAGAAKALTHENDIRALAEGTGGLWQPVGTAADFSAFLDAIVDVMASLYTVTYTTSNPRRDGAWREVIVTLTDPVAGTDCDDSSYQAPRECQSLVVDRHDLEAACLTGTHPADIPFSVANACAGRLEYRIAVDAAWLSVSPDSGASTWDWNEHTVHVDAASLPAGDYEGHIHVSGAGQTETVTVSLAVTDLLVTRAFADGCHRPGDRVDVAVTFLPGETGTVTSLRLHETLPAGWSYLGVMNPPGPECNPPEEAPQDLEFTWQDIPTFPYTLVYRVQAPDEGAGPDAYGWHCVQGQAAWSTTGPERWTGVHGAQCLELVDCGEPCATHRVDQDADWIVDLTPELTRLIQFHNRRGYHVQAGTEDGYAPTVGATAGPPHQADQNRDWVIQLSPELTRIIQLYNGGGYHCQAGTEDGYAPGRLAKAAGVTGSLTSARSFGSALYDAGTTLEVSVTLSHTHPDALTSLAVEETLPAGWSFAGVVSTPAPPVCPVAGTGGALGFAWIAVPALWPVTLTYRVSIPAGTVGTQTFSGAASFREDAGETTVVTPPTPIGGHEATITHVAGVGGSLVGTQVQTVPIGGATTPVTAVPDPNSQFVQWTLDGAPYSLADTVTVDPVTADLTLAAEFQPVTHTVTFVAGPGGRIVGPNPQGVPHDGTGLAVTATPLFGYLFTQWHDGVVTPTRTVANVTTDLTLTASFRAANEVAPNGTFLAVTDAAAVGLGHGLWNLSGAYATVAAGHPLVLSLVHDTKGKLTGSATYTPAGAPAVAMPVKGSTKGTEGNVVVTIALKGSDPTKAVSVALALNLTVNAAARHLTGPMTGRVTINGVQAPVSASQDLAIPPPMDGTWTLLFVLQQGPRNLSGTAVLDLSNGMSYAYVVKGKPRAGQAALLSLSGAPADPAAKGIRIKATITALEGGWARIGAFSAKGFGQTVVWP